jgi:nucleotide-binding universal stress UspA family protein
LKTLLVPLDGSPLAERALPYATALARLPDTRLVLLTTVYSAGKEQPSPPDLEAVAQPIRASGVTVEPWVYSVDYPDPAAAICAGAAERQADLIVMSTHGRSGLGRWLYGSVADAVLRRTALPVVLVSAVCDRTWPTDRPLRILVPLDGSPRAEAALGPATLLAEQLRATLTVLQVVHGFSRTPDAYVEEYRNEVRQYLATVSERTPQVTSAVDLYGGNEPTARTIADFADVQEIDLIAMATHGRGGLARQVLGSTATELLHRARVPLLLVRATDLRPSEAAPESAKRSKFII